MVMRYPPSSHQSAKWFPVAQSHICNHAQMCLEGVHTQAETQKGQLQRLAGIFFSSQSWLTMRCITSCWLMSFSFASTYTRSLSLAQRLPSSCPFAFSSPWLCKYSSLFYHLPISALKVPVHAQKWIHMQTEAFHLMACRFGDCKNFPCAAKFPNKMEWKRENNWRLWVNSDSGVCAETCWEMDRGFVTKWLPARDLWW